MSLLALRLSFHHTVPRCRSTIVDPRGRAFPGAAGVLAGRRMDGEAEERLDSFKPM